MGSTMSMGSTGSTETESSLESSCSKDSASTSSSLSTSSCEPASTVSYGSAAGGGSGSITSKTTETSTAAYATPRKDVARTSPIASTDLSTAITQELQRRAQQVRLIDIDDTIGHVSRIFFCDKIAKTIRERNVIRNTVPYDALLSFYRNQDAACFFSRFSLNVFVIFLISIRYFAAVIFAISLFIHDIYYVLYFLRVYRDRN